MMTGKEIRCNDYSKVRNLGPVFERKAGNGGRQGHLRLEMNEEIKNIRKYLPLLSSKTRRGLILIVYNLKNEKTNLPYLIDCSALLYSTPLFRERKGE